MHYITPQMLRQMAQVSNDLTPYTDAQLLRLIELATGEVNRYCAAPKIPTPHDFRGGTISSEQHIWDLGNNYRRGSDRVYPLHTPVQAVTFIDLRLTPDQYVQFLPADIYINNAEGWMEVVSLARRLSVFSAGYVPLLGLLEPVAEVSYTYGYVFTQSNEPLYAQDGTYTVYRAQNQWWTADPVTVTKNGSPISSGFTLNATEGTVTFSPALLSTDVVTISYNYTLPEEIRDATALVVSNAITSGIYTAANMIEGMGLRIEEAEMRPMMRGQAAGGSIFQTFVDGRAAQLLESFRFRSWGGN